MNYHEYTNKMKDAQVKLIEYIDCEDKIEENFENIILFISDNKYLENPQEFKSLLYIIAKIEENHHRCSGFEDKIEQFLKYYKDYITNNYSNIEIFKIFRNNLLTILFFIKEEILAIDNYNYKILMKNKFFMPELETFIKNNDMQINDEFDSSDDNEYEENQINKEYDIKNLPDDFEEKRKIGENDNYICQLIRHDLIEEFIIYVNKNNYPLKSKIEPSLYETNSLLISNQPTLIEYASFFGSIQIFKYLNLNGVELTQSLLKYAVHGYNPEIIHILEENKILPQNESIIIESIKCHHNDFANYFKNYILNNEKGKMMIERKIYSSSFHYRNYLFLPIEYDYNFIIYYASKYDYFAIVDFCLKTMNFNIKNTICKIIKSSFLQYLILLLCK